jgi:hypothetical protein
VDSDAFHPAPRVVEAVSAYHMFIEAGGRYIESLSRFI